MNEHLLRRHYFMCYLEAHLQCGGCLVKREESQDFEDRRV
jgi:hypothetical protein